jgi:hypothetical protein
VEPKTRDEAREMLGRRKLQTAIDKEGDGLHLAADLRATDKLVGHISLFYGSQEHRQGEVGSSSIPTTMVTGTPPKEPG